MPVKPCIYVSAYRSVARWTGIYHSSSNAGLLFLCLLSSVAVYLNRFAGKQSGTKACCSLVSFLWLFFFHSFLSTCQHRVALALAAGLRVITACRQCSRKHFAAESTLFCTKTRRGDRLMLYSLRGKHASLYPPPICNNKIILKPDHSESDLLRPGKQQSYSRILPMLAMPGVQGGCQGYRRCRGNRRRSPSRWAGGASPGSSPRGDNRCSAPEARR